MISSLNVIRVLQPKLKLWQSFLLVFLYSLWQTLFNYRFSAFWLRSKCSICSYQLNIWYGPYMGPRILNWFLETGGMSGLAPLPSRVGPVLQYLRDRRTPLEGKSKLMNLKNWRLMRFLIHCRNHICSFLAVEYIE